MVSRRDYLAHQPELCNTVRSAADIDDSSAEGLVERGIGRAIALDPSSFPEGELEGCAEGESAVFGGMVVVDPEIPLARQLEGEAWGGNSG